jgi:CubicO group peptidase (beta-lactamase class C family)
MGDVLPDEPFPAELDMSLVAQALDTAFGGPDAMTEAIVVTYNGRVIGERYGEGIDLHTPLESWSMGKSLTGALMGILIHRGVYDLWQSAPIPEWQTEGDPRQQIRIGDIMRMSSGLRIRAPQDPDFDLTMRFAQVLEIVLPASSLKPKTSEPTAFTWMASHPAWSRVVI